MRNVCRGEHGTDINLVALAGSPGRLSRPRHLTNLEGGGGATNPLHRHIMHNLLRFFTLTNPQEVTSNVLYVMMNQNLPQSNFPFCTTVILLFARYVTWAWKRVRMNGFPLIGNRYNGSLCMDLNFTSPEDTLLFSLRHIHMTSFFLILPQCHLLRLP